MNNQSLSNAIPILVTVVPVLLVWLGGIVLAAINWRRCPTSSLLVVLAMLDLAAFRIVGSVVSFVGIPLMRNDWAWNNEQVARVLAINGFAGTAGAIVGYVLLLAAVYIGRPAIQVTDIYGPSTLK